MKEKLIGPELVSVPEPPPPGAATASSLAVKTVHLMKVCGEKCKYWWIELKNPSYFYGRDPHTHLDYAEWEYKTEVHIKWYWPAYYSPELSVYGEDCGKAGPEKVNGGGHDHLTAWGRFRIHGEAFFPWGDVEGEDEYLELQIWVWPNGDQEKYVTNWSGQFVPNQECAE